jgi:hypothetical protein
MKLAFMRHQIGGQLADGGAIHHQPEMLRPHMIAPFLQTFGHGSGETNGMTEGALLNGKAGFLRELIHRPSGGETCGRERKL